MMLNHSGPVTTAPDTSKATLHHPGRSIIPPAIATPPDQQNSWESLAFDAQFRPGLLARRCGVSLRTLERHFIKHYQITVSEYLRKLRLNLAYIRLQNGERAKCVAYDLGYKQPSHFSRDFKNFYGVPPRAIQPTWLPPPPIISL